MRDAACGSLTRSSSNSGPLLLFTAFKLRANLRIGARERDVVDRGTGVQAGPADENRADATRLQVGDGIAGKLLKSGHGHRVIRIDDVDKMMRHGGLFLGGRLGGADIHAAVHLVGVRVDDLGAFTTLGQALGYGDAESGLA